MMAIETYGFDDFDAILTQMGQEFGYTDVNKKVLIPALRNAMKVTLPYAKSLARSNTGQMRNSIMIEARRPTDRDKKSKYIYDSDAAIAIISVKQSQVSLGEEFGTAKKAGQPFIRPALEANQSVILQTLSDELKKKIERYKSRNARDTK
jgi:HK97 gp10 family phage protein